MQNLIATDLEFPLDRPAGRRFRVHAEWLRSLGVQVLEDEKVDAFHSKEWFQGWESQRAKPVAPVGLVLAEHVWPSTGPGSTRQKWTNDHMGLWSALTSNWPEATVVLVLRPGDMSERFNSMMRMLLKSQTGLFHKIQLGFNMRNINGTLWYQPLQVTGTEDCRTISTTRLDVALVKLPRNAKKRLGTNDDWSRWCTQDIPNQDFVREICWQCLKEEKTVLHLGTYTLESTVTLAHFCAEKLRLHTRVLPPSPYVSNFGAQ